MKTLLGMVVGALGALTTYAQAPVPQWTLQIGRSGPASHVAHISHGRTSSLTGGDPVVITSRLTTYGPVLCIVGPRGDSLRSMTLPRPFGHDMANVFGATEMANGDFLISGFGYDISSIAANPNAPNPYLTTSYHFLTRIDSLGNVRWQRLFNQGMAHPYACPPLRLPDGGALVLLTTNPPPGTNNLPADRPVLLRVDSLGNVLARHAYGNYQNGFRQLSALADGSYALGGWAFRRVPGSPFALTDGWVLRVTVDGDTLRSTYLGGAYDMDAFASMRPTAGGGLLLGGYHIPQGLQRPPLPQQGWLVQLDSLDRVQWQQYFISAPPGGAVLTDVEALANGDVLLRGGYDPTGTHSAPADLNRQYLARWRPGPAGPPLVPVWESYRNDFGGSNQPNAQCLTPDGRFTMGGTKRVFSTPAGPAGLTRYANIGTPYVPAYCAVPPLANLAFARPAPDSLVLIELSLPGPRYAQLVRFRWQWGDGTATTRLAATGGRVRHRYAAGQLPAPGTPVTLTVTNNLGCTHTATVYPFGAPSATARARALAAGAALFPNPAAEAATLAVPGLPAGPPLPGEVADALGRVVRRFAAPVRGGTATAALDLAGLPPGVYAVRLHTTEGSIVKRLVRQ